jgi:hypothetical protein
LNLSIVFELLDVLSPFRAFLWKEGESKEWGGEERETDTERQKGFVSIGEDGEKSPYFDQSFWRCETMVYFLLPLLFQGWCLH